MYPPVCDKSNKQIACPVRDGACPRVRGSPRQVRALFGAALKLTGDVPLGTHFHDTRGLGLANALAALETGIRRFDSSIAGLGGCPFAPGATGNISTEDLVFLLKSEGFETGIDIMALQRARDIVDTALPEERRQGNILQAGLPKGFKGIAGVGAGSVAAE